MPATVHRVEVSSCFQDLPKSGAGINLRIFRKKSVVGRLLIGRGGLRWLGKNKMKGKKLSWPALALMMNKR